MTDIKSSVDFFDYTFKDPNLLRGVFFHPSLGQIRAKQRQEPNLSFERLEFLGDRVLGILIAQLLYEKYPNEDEGALALRFSSLVRMETLYAVCKETGLDTYILHELPPHEKTGKNLLADAMEAFIAALYLDGGLEVASRFTHQYFTPLLEDAGRDKKPAKTALQELAHRKKFAAPTYTLLSRTGPDHLPTFEVELTIPQTPHKALAKGPSLKEAQNLAAIKLLKTLGRGERFIGSSYPNLK